MVKVLSVNGKIPLVDGKAISATGGGGGGGVQPDWNQNDSTAADCVPNAALLHSPPKPTLRVIRVIRVIRATKAQTALMVLTARMEHPAKTARTALMVSHHTSEKMETGISATQTQANRHVVNRG